MGRVRAVGVCGVVLLAGCSGSFNGLNQTQGSQTTGGSAGARLVGSVHGGQQPIVGAHVYLLAAGTGGYGQASTSLLTAGTGSDALGQYVITDGSGGFSITGSYTCAAGSQVYLYTLGGDPGAGTNSAAGLMAALGSCPVAGVFPSSMFISVNEVSTVAAAYAFAGFATDATHVSNSGTALAQTGIANAFANAANLADMSTGAALATTPAGNGAVPQAEINTLANILAACVNSTGPPSAGCSTLFSNSMDGATTPTDTATAAINIAHHPAANVASLFGLAASTPPFGPGLGAVPNDWTLELRFSGGGMTSVYKLAVDEGGNVWVTDNGANSVIKLSSLGAVLSGANGYKGSGINFPRLVAIDPTGNAWIASGSMTSVVEISEAGNILSGASGFTGNTTYGHPAVQGATGMAIDGSGNVWVPTFAGNSGVSEFTNTGNFVGWIDTFHVLFSNDPLNGAAIDSSGNAWVADNKAGSTVILRLLSADLGGSGGFLEPGGGIASPYEIAFDSSGNAWITNPVNNSISKISSSGVALSPSSGYTASSMVVPTTIAVDGTGNVWVAGNTSKNVVEFSNSGGVISGTTGYRSGILTYSISIDGSGNLWGSSVSNYVYELVGVAAPVVTPLSLGVRNNTLGTRP